MIVILQLNTGAYCSSTKLDITIAKRLLLPLRSFSHCSIHPFNLALSFLPLLWASLSILPFLPSHTTHGLPFHPICQQLQMFIIKANTFDNSCEQLKCLPKRRMKLHLATEGTIMTCFSLFSAEEKEECLIFSFNFSAKEVNKLNLFRAARCFIHKLLE